MLKSGKSSKARQELAIMKQNDARAETDAAQFCIHPPAATFDPGCSGTGKAIQGGAVLV